MAQQLTCSFDTLVASLAPYEQHLLLNRSPIVHAQDDRYSGQILIPASQQQVWNVMTDYSNFDQFLPSVKLSTVLEAAGDRTVVEQVSSVKVMLADVQSRIRTENIETPQSRIDFRLIQGDLKLMKGAWTLQPVTMHGIEADDWGETAVLLRQTVRARAGKGWFEGVFSMIFTNSMKENLTALCCESQRREQHSKKAMVMA